MFSPASPVSAALSDGAKPEPHTLNNALIPPARCARLETHFCQDSASGCSEQKVFVPGGCWGGKFLDVPMQWTIYLVEKVLHWRFPPGIYGLGLLFLGFYIFFWNYCPSLRLAKCSVSGEIEGSDNKTSPLLFVPFKFDENVPQMGLSGKRKRARASKWILKGFLWLVCEVFSAVWKLKWHHLPEMRFWPCFVERKIEIPKGFGMLRSPWKGSHRNVSNRINSSSNLY